MHTTDTRNKILKFIRQNQCATNKQLQHLTGITQVGISKHLRILLDNESIVKKGTHPRHTYHLSQKEISRLNQEIVKEMELKAKNVNESPEFKKTQEEIGKSLRSSLIKAISDKVKESKDVPEEIKAKVLEDLEKKAKVRL